MLLTEEEARGNREKNIPPKQCRIVPLIPVQVGASLSQAQPGVQFQTPPCTASNCVLWDWWTDDKTHGYCSLGGTPRGPRASNGEHVVPGTPGAKVS